MNQPEIKGRINFFTEEFIKTGFFPYAMEVFCLAHSNDLPIPKAVMDAVAYGFMEWGKYGGAKNHHLDDIFKLKPGCSGHLSVLVDEWTVKRNTEIFHIIETLTMINNWSQEDAIAAASAWAEEQYRVDPILYKWLKPNNSGRSSDESTSLAPVTCGTIKKDIWGKRNSDLKKIYSEIKARVKSYKLMWDEEKIKEVEKFYFDLIADREKFKL